MVQPIILEKLEQLSESLQTEVLHYIEFLSERYLGVILKSKLTLCGNAKNTRAT